MANRKNKSFEPLKVRRLLAASHCLRRVILAGMMFGVYIHIPYCKTVCPYCDFVKTKTEGAVPEAFVEALCREIAEFEGPGEADSVFLGGGTPSLVRPGDLARILAAVAGRFRLDEAEITLEANPDDVTPGMAQAWRKAGINRVSLGVQSFDDAVLAYLGRRHGARAARTACGTVAAVFDNWSLDLIFGARPAAAWSATLAECAALAPPHVSAYGLTYEAATPFGKRQDEAVSDEESLALYQAAEAALEGYGHYEISNFARPGREAVHNLIYWHNEEYAGFGPGAYSFVGGVRARNLAAVDGYLRRPGAKGESIALTAAEIRVETLIQHFRLRAGLPLEYYARRFGRTVYEDYAAPLAALSARGLLEAADGVLRPTAAGFYLNNEIGLALVE